MSPKAHHTTKGGGDFDQRIVPEGWYHLKLAWIGDPKKPTGQYARGDEVRALGFDIVGGEYAGIRCFLAFGIPLYAALDDTTGEKLLNDPGFPRAYRLHPSSSAAKLSAILVGYEPEGREEGEEVLSIPDAWEGAECEGKITNYTYQAEDGEKTVNQIYTINDLRRLQALTAAKEKQILQSIKEAKEQGMNPEEDLVPFLKQEGIPSSAAGMVRWTERQADLVLDFLIEWTGAPDEEVVMQKKQW